MPRADTVALSSRTRRIDPDDAMAALHRAEGRPRIYWAEGDHEAVAIGCLHRITATGARRFEAAQAEVDRLLGNASHRSEDDVPADIGPRAYGGFAFLDDHEPMGRWAAFPSALLTIPETQLLWVDGAAYETSNTVQGADAAPMAVDRATARPEENHNERARWDHAVRHIVREIRDGRLTKAVLARTERRPVPHHVDRVLARLADQPASTIRFLFEPAPGHAFYGASPEILVRLNNTKVSTAALAGSIARGATPGQDDDYARRLLESPKDALEHELVVSYIRERLAAAGARTGPREPRRIRRLPNVQHLETPIAAEASPGTRVLGLAATLHPTPAVGGIPRDASLRLLRTLEGFHRGWYAGAVGWVDAAGQGTFATAIRSAVTTPEATWLFAGAGIVAGSEPADEWEETRIKFRLMEEALVEADAP